MLNENRKLVKEQQMFHERVWDIIQNDKKPLGNVWPTMHEVFNVVMFM